MSAVIWIHADALSRAHPVFCAAPDGAHEIFIWDAADIARRGWSLKRCLFVLECLAEMDVDIVQGDTDEVLSAIDGTQIFMAQTHDPQRIAVIECLENRVVIVPDYPFADLPDGADMGRFFRYWNKAKRSVMTRTQPGDR